MPANDLLFGNSVTKRGVLGVSACQPVARCTTLAGRTAYAARFGKLDPSGMGDLDFGAALPAGLSPAALAGDLNVSGSLLGGGRIEHVNLVYVPEPGTAGLLAAGLVVLLWWHRRRRR